MSKTHSLISKFNMYREHLGVFSVWFGQDPLFMQMQLAADEDDVDLVQYYARKILFSLPYTDRPIGGHYMLMEIGNVKER